jgi:hypothetical protein
MDNPIRRPNGLMPLLAALLGLGGPALTDALRRVQGERGRNDRKAQRAGEIAPAGTYTAGPHSGRKQARLKRWLKGHTPPPEPKFPPESGKRRYRGTVRVGAQRRLVIPRPKVAP